MQPAETSAEDALAPATPPWLRAGAQEVMHTLYDIAQRANAAWQRMGQDEAARQARLQHFFSHSLTLFLTDFCTLAEAEERDCVLENDAQLRELYFLASYLRQAPQMPLLARLLGALAQSRDAPPTDDTATTTECETVPASPSSFPSFTQWLSPSKADIADATPCNAVEQAMRAWLRQATHVEIGQVLQRECAALSTLAELRLSWLRFIRRRRALLECSVKAQARCGRLSLSDRAVQPAGNAESAQAAKVEDKEEEVCEAVKAHVKSASRLSSVGFTSAMSSAAASTQLPPLAGSTARAAEGEKDTGAVNANDAQAVSQLQDSMTAHSIEEDEELRLLLDASLYLDGHDTRGTAYCLQPRSTVATLRQTLQSRRMTVRATTTTAAANAAGASSKGNSDRTSRSSTAQQAQQDTNAAVSATEQASSEGKKEAEHKAAVPEAAEMPVLDTSEVDRYGTRQDLSLDRLVREANEVLQQMQTCHAAMLHEIDTELACVHELHDRIAATMQEEQEEDRKTAKEVEANGAVQPAAAAAAVMLPVTCDEVEAKTRQMRAEYEAASTSAACVASTSASNAEDDPNTPPTVLQRLAAMPSPAATLDYIRTARAQLQAALLRCHVQRVRRVHAALQAAYKAYYEATNDAAYAAFPACELWLREVGGSDADAEDAHESDAAALADLPATAAMASLQTRLQAAADMVARAAKELTGLQRRLDILTRAAPLLAHRAQILREQQEMREGSRARLLSKKINMAKQLLHEEVVRRRIAKELPAIALQLQGLVQSWEMLMIDDDRHASAAHEERAARPLCVHGVDVKALLAECGTGKAATATSTARRGGEGSKAGYAAALDRSRSQPTRDKAASSTISASAPLHRAVTRTPVTTLVTARPPFQGRLHTPAQMPRVVPATTGCISPRPRRPAPHTQPLHSASASTPAREGRSGPCAAATAASSLPQHTVVRSASPPALTNASSQRTAHVTPSVLTRRGATLKRLRSASQTRHFAPTPSPPAQRTLRVMHF